MHTTANFENRRYLFRWRVKTPKRANLTSHDDNAVSNTHVVLEVDKMSRERGTLQEKAD